jgi:hypothetical protein
MASATGTVVMTELRIALDIFTSIELRNAPAESITSVLGWLTRASLGLTGLGIERDIGSDGSHRRSWRSVVGRLVPDRLRARRILDGGNWLGPGRRTAVERRPADEEESQQIASSWPHDEKSSGLILAMVPGSALSQPGCGLPIS